MRGYDLTPLLRSSVGFDRMASLLDTLAHGDDGATGYPPYNIEKLSEDAYRITMAVAGFTDADLTITAKGTSLVISGKAKSDGEDVTYLHRGIAGRAFERRFELAEHIKVSDAHLENGLLHINLKREVPEAMKPRQIQINAADHGSVTTLEADAAGRADSGAQGSAQGVAHAKAA